MSVATIRTADLPVDQRFPFWRELADHSHVPTILETEHPGDWDATMRIHDLGSFLVSTQEHPPCVARRPARLIRQSDPESLYVVVPLRGRMAARQRDRDADCGTDSFVLLDTSQPTTVANPAATSHLLAQVPRSSLPSRHPFEHLLARPVPIRHGLGAALVHILRELMDGQYPATVVSQLAQTALDLLVAIQLASAGGSAAMPSDSRLHAKLVLVCAYIWENLADPSLTLARVARVHHISLRQLDRLFQRAGTTPAAWLRDQRLDRCRRDLVDPAHTGTPASAIGARWGYIDPATFNRAFSRAYGSPPGEYRRHHTMPPR